MVQAVEHRDPEAAPRGTTNWQTDHSPHHGVSLRQTNHTHPHFKITGTLVGQRIEVGDSPMPRSRSRRLITLFPIVAAVVLTTSVLTPASGASLSDTYEAQLAANEAAARTALAPHGRTLAATARWTNGRCLQPAKKAKNKRVKKRLTAKCEAQYRRARTTYRDIVAQVETTKRGADEAAAVQFRDDWLAAKDTLDAAQREAQRLFFAEHEELSIRDDAARAAAWSDYQTCIAAASNDGARDTCLATLDQQEAAILTAWNAERDAIAERQDQRNIAASQAYSARVGKASYACVILPVECHSFIGSSS